MNEMEHPIRMAVYAESTRRTSAAMTSDDNTHSTTSSATRERLPHREAASTFFDCVQHHVDDAIDEMYLFGSVVGGAEVADSDVDVLAVISDEATFADVDDLLLDIAYDVQLEHEIRIEVHSIAHSEFTTRLERGDPFIRTVVDAGETCL